MSPGTLRARFAALCLATAVAGTGITLLHPGGAFYRLACGIRMVNRVP